MSATAVTSRSQHFTTLLPSLKLLAFFLLLFYDVPWALARAEGVDVDVPFSNEHSIATYSLHFNQLWVSAGATDHCRKKCFCPWLWAALIYEYNCLEVSLPTCPVSKTIVVGSSLGPMASQVVGLDQVYSTRHELFPVQQASSPMQM